jgi:hypothetical protein
MTSLSYTAGSKVQTAIMSWQHSSDCHNGQHQHHVWFRGGYVTFVQTVALKMHETLQMFIKCRASFLPNRHFRTNQWLLQYTSNTAFNTETRLVRQFMNSINGFVYAAQKKCLLWGTNKYLSLRYKKFRLQRLRNVSFMAQQPLVDQSLLIIMASRSYSDTPYSLGLLWMSDQPGAQTSTCITHNTHNRQTCESASVSPHLYVHCLSCSVPFIRTVCPAPFHYSPISGKYFTYRWTTRVLISP